MAKCFNERIMERCALCNRVLLVDPDSHYCLTCENRALRERIAQLEFQLEQSGKKLRCGSK